MSETLRVRVVLGPDAYWIVRDDNGEPAEYDHVGFSESDAAVRHAEREGWEVVNK